MRIDARAPGFYENGGGRWRVYHAEIKQFLNDVVWVDDETNEYGRFSFDRRGHVSHKARKIEIHVGVKLIIINPDEINKQLGIETVQTVGKPTHTDEEITA